MDRQLTRMFVLMPTLVLTSLPLAAQTPAELQTQAEVARAAMATAAGELATLNDRLLAASPASNVYQSQQYLGITVAETPRGLLVRAVTPGGPAAEAGIEVDDAIFAINGTDLTGQFRFQQGVVVNELDNMEPGADARLSIRRGNEIIEAAVTPRPAQQGTPLYFQLDWSRMQLATLTPDLGRYFGANRGLLLVRAPSDPSIGLRDGDVLLAIGGQAVDTPVQVLRQLAEPSSEGTVVIEILRDGAEMSIAWVAEQR